MHVECIKCAHIERYPSPVEGYYYTDADLEDGELLSKYDHSFHYVPHNIGWCKSCKAIVEFEQMPSIQECNEKIQQFLVEIKQLKEMKIPYSESWTRTQKMPYKRHINKIKNYENWVENLKYYLSILPNRKSGNRCLSCGSENSYITMDEFIENTVHDNCGGKWQYAGNIGGICGRFPLHIYNTEGELIAVSNFKKLSSNSDYVIKTIKNT